MLQLPLLLPSAANVTHHHHRLLQVEGIPRLMVFSPKTGATLCENAVGTPLTNFQFDKWERAA